MPSTPPSRGVFGYLTKPFDSQILLEKSTVPCGSPTIDAGPASAPGRRGRGRRWPGWKVIFRSAKMAALMADARMVAASDASVLIRGESGSGKEVLARAIHRASPTRQAGPFVAINCGAIPEQLLESELFGHARAPSPAPPPVASACFQTANGGTLFLDEIGDMPLALQVKLLRVLQARRAPVGATKAEPVDVRLLFGDAPRS